MDIRSNLLHAVRTGVLVGNFAGQSERKEQSQHTQNGRKDSEFFHNDSFLSYSLPLCMETKVGLFTVYNIKINIARFLFIK